ncbi:hypothetical protein MPL3356_60627 [Mesorhizobium plurifarium]|uniref:DUF7352 domain-containing protein n=1 Tax=Mesorhizobium plurifarium TaxID=69974 RepID=A0A090EAH6_MESPL|nr:hypothetical protein MPL3356_60627 [Mesorhizobium plurifarium]
MGDKLNTIWKFKLSHEAAQSIKVPREYSFLSIGLDRDDHRCIWLMVNADAPPVQLEIIKVATGDRPVPHLGDYLGTISQDGNIWHYFTGPGHAGNTRTSFHYHTRSNG